MKHLITILFLFMTLIMNSQTYTLDCYSCEGNKVIDCHNCDIEDELFTGIILTSSSTPPIVLWSPVQIKTRSRQIYFEDAFGTSKQISITKISNYTTFKQLFDSLSICFCSSTSFIESQALATNGFPGNISISEGNSITMNVDDDDSDTTNEIQDLQLITNILAITNKTIPTLIDLSPYLDNTDDQTLVWNFASKELSIEDGNTVTLLHDHSAVDITSGVLDNARVSSQSVIQHEGDLSITESQITDLIHTVDTATYLIQDSILVYYVLGVEIGRDTIRGSGTGGGDGNNYVDGAVFNPLDGVLSLSRNGLGVLTESLDGRYLETEIDGSITNELQDLSWNDGSNTISITNGAAATLTGFANSAHNHSTVEITSGVFADPRIGESNITQHEAALSITENQISDLSHTINTDTTSWLMDNDSVLDVKVLGVHFRYDTIRLAGTGGVGDGNNYVDGTTFNTGNGILTLTRSGLADLTQDLDGRYLESFTEVDGSITNEHQDLAWNNGTNTVEINNGTNAIITGFADDTHNHSATDLTSGVLADARVQETNVTQHENALSIDAEINTVTNIGFSEFDTDVSNTMQFTGGAYLDQPDVSVSSDGTTVTLSIEKVGGGDLRVIFLDGVYIWDCTPIATVALTAGSDVSPTMNYIYLRNADKILTVSTSGFPTEDIIRVATVLCQSATHVQNDGAYKVHSHTDHMASTTCGHLSHVNAWIRAQSATYISGGALTPTGGASTYDISTAAAIVLQLHDHDFPSYNTATGSYIHVVNDNTTAYKEVGNMSAETTDADGSSLLGKYYTVVYWGVVSEDAVDCKLMANLPTGSYNNNNSNKAIDDDNKYNVYNIPNDFTGTGFLIAAVTVSESGGTFTIENTADLRGLLPSVSAGGGAIGGNEFADNVFLIQDDLDVTKQLAFQVSGVTTATTRTLTIPNKDGTIALISDIGGSSSTLEDIATNSTGTVEQTFALDNLTDAIFEKSDGTDILTIDGTNGIVGINATPIVGRDLTLTNYQFLRGYIGSDLYIHNDGSTTDFFAGQNAGLSTSATNSNGIGKNALLSSSGSNNDAMGVSAGSSNTGSKNVFLGNSTGVANSGADNVLVGYFAGRNKGSGAQNTYIGSNAGKNSTSSANVCIGYYSGAENGNSFLTAVGQQSGENSNGDDNSFFGYAAGASAIGNNILGLGAYSLRSSNGDDNIGIGHATSEEVVGDNNIAIGRYSLAFNKGSNNSAVGVNAMRNAGTGTNNVALGYRAGDNMHGSDNTALGGSSLPLQLTGVTLVVSSVDVPNDRVTITGHGLVVGDKYPLYVVSSTIGGLSMGNIYNFKVIDANILEVSVVVISSTGDMTLERYQEVSNSTWIGAGAYPTKSDQVVLGDVNVTETLLRGGVGIDIEPTETLDVNGNVKIRGSIVTSTDDHGTVGQIPISQGADVPWIWGANGGGGGSFVARSVLVAAKNSYWNGNGADYDCDSINDEVQIIAALNYARDNNIRLVEADGDFQLDDTLKLLANYDGITLKGFGRTNTVFHGSMTADDSWIEFLFEQDTLTDFTLKDFTLDASTILDNTAGNNQGIICAKKEVYTENLTLDNIKVIGTGGYNAAISFSFEDDTKVGKFTNFTMKNCELEMDGDGKTGVYCFRMTHYSDGVDIHNNKVTILNADGGDNNFNPLSLYGSAKHFSIKDNFVYGYGQVHSCIAVSPGSKGTISGNYTYMGEPYTFESGIEVEMKRGAHTADDTDSVQYVTITGNVIESRLNNGVGGRYSCGIIVRDYDNTPDTIYPTGVTISGNSINRCDYGLRIEEARDLVVSGNGFHGCGQNTYYGRTDNTPHDVGFSETHLNGLRVGNEQMSIFDMATRSYEVFLSRGATSNIFGEEIEVDRTAKEVTIGVVDTVLVTINGSMQFKKNGRSVMIGEDAGLNMDISSDRNNFGLGYQSFRFCTTCSQNVGIGNFTLDASSFTGFGNVAIGSYSLTSLTSGGTNIAIGYESQQNQQTGDKNISFGYRALQNVTNSSENTAIGRESLMRATGTNYTIAIGVNALKNQTTGDYNVAIGNNSFGTGSGFDVGGYNVGLGYKAGESQQGHRNTIIGAFAGDNAAYQTTNDNIYLGYGAGMDNTSSNMLIIENNTHKLIEGDFTSKITTFDYALKHTPTSAAPTPSEGVTYYDSDDDKLKVYANGQWDDLNGAGGSPVSIIAGNGLTGGGLLDADRTIHVIPGTGLKTTANDISIQTLQYLEWSGSQTFQMFANTDAATITWDHRIEQVSHVVLGGNRTLANPTNSSSGGLYTFIFVQDATGSRTVTFSSNYKFPGGTAPTLTTAANAVDVMTCVNRLGDQYCKVELDFK